MDDGGWPGLRVLRGLVVPAVTRIEVVGLVARVAGGTAVRLVATDGAVPAAGLLSMGFRGRLLPEAAAGARGTVLERLVR